MYEPEYNQRFKLYPREAEAIVSHKISNQLLLSGHEEYLQKL